MKKRALSKMKMFFEYTVEIHTFRTCKTIELRNDSEVATKCEKFYDPMPKIFHGPAKDKLCTTKPSNELTYLFICFHPLPPPTLFIL